MMLVSILFAALLGTSPSTSPREAMGTHSSHAFSPYENTAANTIYNLLFCDRRESFRARQGERSADWQRVLFTEPPKVFDLKMLADNASEEGRIRYLAFAGLREAGAPVTPKILLGVIVEMALPDGLDALAAYSDGGVRYINRSGKIAVVEGADGFRPQVDRLFEAAQPVVARIGPWNQPRRPPPVRGNARLTFLVSDGLYFGEAKAEVFQRDALAGPVLREATQLLLKVVAMVNKPN